VPLAPGGEDEPVRDTYEVAAHRWENGWELRIEGVGVTQSRTLLDAEAMTRDYISSLLKLPEDSFDVTVVAVTRESTGPGSRLGTGGRRGGPAGAEEREVNRLINERMADPAPGVPWELVLRETLDRAAD
jgi:hypothetical protein